jgi:hypothetical protein
VHLGKAQDDIGADTLGIHFRASPLAPPPKDPKRRVGAPRRVKSRPVAPPKLIFHLTQGDFSSAHPVETPAHQGGERGRRLRPKMPRAIPIDETSIFPQIGHRISPTSHKITTVPPCRLAAPFPRWNTILPPNRHN